MDKQESVTTTVAFDRTTYKRIRLLAVERETNVRDIIRKAVGEYLEREQKKGARR